MTSAFSNIKGFVPNSLVDWDGKISAVLFLGGCNFKCVFCSNKDIATEPDKIASLNFNGIKKILEKNKEFVDGVVITGGEPTMYGDLPELCGEIKKLGFKVKIDTNGSNPDMLEEMLEGKILDSIAMDIKTSFEKYKDIVNSEVDIDKIKKSISIVSRFPDYEFRTTVFPAISREDLIKIAEYLREKNANKKFFLQQFRAENCISEEAEKMKPYLKAEIEEFLDLVKPYFNKCEMRNV